MQLAADMPTVLVGTLEALDQVRVKRDRFERKLRRGQPLSTNEIEVWTRTTEMMSWLARFDLVVVDQGHYEPVLMELSVSELNVRQFCSARRLFAMTTSYSR